MNAQVLLNTAGVFETVSCGFLWYKLKMQPVKEILNYKLTQQLCIILPAPEL